MSNAITVKDWVLVHANTGQPVSEGETVLSFRGDAAVITGGNPPHKPASTGRVQTKDGGEFFPTVFDLKWVKAE